MISSVTLLSMPRHRGQLPPSPAVSRALSLSPISCSQEKNLMVISALHHAKV